MLEEAESRKEKRGLWADLHPIPPGHSQVAVLFVGRGCLLSLLHDCDPERLLQDDGDRGHLTLLPTYVVMNTIAYGQYLGTADGLWGCLWGVEANSTVWRRLLGKSPDDGPGE